MPINRRKIHLFIPTSPSFAEILVNPDRILRGTIFEVAVTTHVRNESEPGDFNRVNTGLSGDNMFAGVTVLGWAWGGHRRRLSGDHACVRQDRSRSEESNELEVGGARVFKAQPPSLAKSLPPFQGTVWVTDKLYPPDARTAFAGLRRIGVQSRITFDRRQAESPDPKQGMSL